MSVPSDLHRGRPPELAARILCAAISVLPTPVLPLGSHGLFVSEDGYGDPAVTLGNQPGREKQTPEHQQRLIFLSMSHHTAHTPVMLSPGARQPCGADTREHPHVLIKNIKKDNLSVPNKHSTAYKSPRALANKDTRVSDDATAGHYPVQSTPL